MYVCGLLYASSCKVIWVIWIKSVNNDYLEQSEVTLALVHLNF